MSLTLFRQWKSFFVDSMCVFKSLGTFSKVQYVKPGLNLNPFIYDQNDIYFSKELLKRSLFLKECEKQLTSYIYGENSTQLISPRLGKEFDSFDHLIDSEGEDPRYYSVFTAASSRKYNFLPSKLCESHFKKKFIMRDIVMIDSRYGELAKKRVRGIYYYSRKNFFDIF